MPNQNVNKVIYGGRVLIDLTGDTVDPSKLLKGSKAHDKSGAQIEGACTFDVDSTDATAVAAEILFGKTAYVSGNKLTGTMKTMVPLLRRSPPETRKLQFLRVSTMAAVKWESTQLKRQADCQQYSRGRNYPRR